jgi:tetratricopeptide (TPR) repeat protein
MTPEETRALVDHLDENITGSSLDRLERLIAEDPEAAQEWYYLNLAVDAVKDHGLYEEVSAIRESWKMEETTESRYHVSTPEELPAARESGSIVRSFNRYGLRAAAIILILMSSTTVYKYLSVSSASLYDRYYSGYTMNTARGSGSEQPIEQAFNAKDWNTVISLAASAKEKDNQTEFLAGMASLEEKRYDDAITHFEQVIAVNTHAGTDVYQDEAEYYLAISWLADKKVNQAMPILEKIKADPHHQYHDKVAKMSFFDLRLAQYKENK